MTASRAVVEQLGDELDAALAGPAGALLGIDIMQSISERVYAAAPMLAAQLAQDQDDNLAAETVQDIMAALWGQADPDPDWWRTPLGRLCARSFGLHDAEAVSHSVAAAMLHMHRGSIPALIAAGKLDRHPDGGVTRASVLMRLAAS